jgi:hypothetical protein
MRVQKKSLLEPLSLLSEISYYQAPQFSHGGGSTRTLTAIAYWDDGVGLQLRGHICGPD